MPETETTEETAPEPATVETIRAEPVPQQKCTAFQLTALAHKTGPAVWPAFMREAVARGQLENRGTLNSPGPVILHRDGAESVPIPFDSYVYVRDGSDRVEFVNAKDFRQLFKELDRLPEALPTNEEL